VFARLKSVLRPFGVYRAARFGWHFATDPIFRRDHLLQWRRPKNLFQFRSITAPDRYPGIFSFLRKRMADRPDLRLLSFGCATGEEVFSLRTYFPRAYIKGIDINRANIATCQHRHRSRGADPALEFECRATAVHEPRGSYDAVFCMAVFVRWRLKTNPDIATCAPHLHFADFERTAAELAACVRPGGYLVMRHTVFRFTDTSAAGNFQPVLRLPRPKEFVPLFDRHDRRLPAEADEGVVFLKRESR